MIPFCVVLIIPELICLHLYSIRHIFKHYLMAYLLTPIVNLLSSYLDQIEHAVSNGDCVLIENIGESLDPVLDPIIGRNTIKKGRYVLQLAGTSQFLFQV